MDPLNWLLFSWLFVAVFVFFILQKLVQIWPEHLGGINESVLDPVQIRKKTPGTVKRDASFLERISSAVTSAAHTVRDAAASAKAEAVAITSPAKSSDWINDLIGWLFNQYRGTPVCVNVWLRSLNDSAKKVTNTAGCEVLFEEIIEDSNSPCQITNLRAEQGPRDHLTIRASIHCPSVGIRLVSSQKLSDRLLVSNYDIRISDLRGEMQMRIACIANELFLMGCFHGRPEMKMTLNNTDSSMGEAVDPACVQEAVRQCIVAAVTNLNLSGLSLTEDKTDNMAYRPVGNGIPSVDEEFKKINTVSPVQQSDLRAGVKRDQLLVKILQAQNLGLEKGEPYVVIEMDDPAQKHTTTLASGKAPTWEEQFLFELGGRSEEILFEVYGKQEGDGEADPVFLGLAIVGIDELRHSNTTTHTLTLQARPYRNDPVSGVLITEFSFLGADFAMGRLVDMRREECDGAITTKISASSKRPLVPNYKADYDIDHKITPIKTTSVLVKSVSQYFQTPAGEAESNRAQPAVPSAPQLVVTSNNQSERDHASQQNSPNLVGEPQLARSSKRVSQNLEGPEPSTSHLSPQPPVNQQNDARGRSGQRTHSFFGDLKQRLSFKGKNKKRAASEGRKFGENVYHPPRAVSTPPSRDQSESRYSTRAKSDVGSTGEVMSTTSSESLYHMSTLVIEVVRNHIKRYYLIPPNMLKHPEARKIMKQGRKLHVFNEHMFSAVRVRSGIMCGVCNMRIAGSFGKQAYQCRDCRMVCHKRCHFKTDNYCINSTVSQLEMYEPSYNNSSL